ncbi:MAG: hypothetical protein DWQ02_15620, partial [Bacteroidetes bacterium]
MFVASIVFSQTSTDPICQEGDCPVEIFNIKLNEPIQPEQYTAERTENFKQAYLVFRAIKAELQTKLDWRDKYDAFQLGGASCLRYYQLESAFGHEFLKNPEFKAFIEKDDPEGAKQMTQNGFRSSRRAANLSIRMDSNCPDQKRTAEKKGGTALSATKNEYQELGYALGYFDKDGNVIKELEQPKEYKPRDRMSKNERVERLNQKVAELPIGPEEQQQLEKAAQDLKTAAPKFEGLKNFVFAFAPLVVAFVPSPLSLLGNVGRATNLLGKLAGTLFKCPPGALLEKAKNLFGKGGKLKEKLQNLVNKSDGLLAKTNVFKKRTEQLDNSFQNSTKALESLRNNLGNLEQQKQDILGKLGDKPKKILEELEKEVAGLESEAVKFKDLLEEEVNKKNQLLEELDDLLKQKDQLEKTLSNLQGENTELEKAANDLQAAADQTQKQIEEAQEKEKELEQKIKKLDEFPSEEVISGNLKICTDELKQILGQLEPAETFQESLNAQYDKVKKRPGRLLEKVKNLKIFQNDLLQGNKGFALAGKALETLGKLSGRTNKVSSVLQLLTGKNTGIGDRLLKIDGSIGQARNLYQNRSGIIDKLKGKAADLLFQKTGIKAQWEKGDCGIDEMNQKVDDFLAKSKVFEEEIDCIDLKDLQKKLQEIKGEQTELAPEIEELEKTLEEAAKEQEQIQQETEALEELAKEQQQLQQQLGDDVNLDPVQPEEWAESFDVKRDYWEAVFHPDDEVVEGYKGRYFQVRLKDADKNVKLLFGPGEYFIERGDFRDTYGSVIGVFVTEALNAMRKADR